MALFGSKARRRAERQSIESAQAAAMRYLDSIVKDDPTICPRRPRMVNVSGVIGDRIEQDYGQRVRAFMSALSELESTRASDAAMRAFKLATVCLAAEVYTSSEDRSKINQGRSSKGRPLWDWDLSDAMVAESRRAAPPDSRRSGNDYRSDGPAGGSDQFLGMTRSLPTIRTQADLDRALAAKTRPTRVELAAVSTTLLSDIEQQPADVRRTLNESHRITADLSELSDEQITAIDRRTGTGWLLDTMAAAGSGYLMDYETYMAQASSAGHDRLLLDASFAAAEMFYALLGGFDQPLQ